MEYLLNMFSNLNNFTFEEIKLIVETHSNDINKPSQYKFQTPLMVLIQFYKISSNLNLEQLVLLLLDHGADVNLVDSSGRTALMYAAERGYFHICEILLDHTADINHQDARGDNVLLIYIQTIYTKNIEFIKMLISRGINLEHQDNSGDNALTLACRFNEYNIVEILVNYIDLQIKTKSGQDALHLAYMYASTRMIKLLAHAGADIDSTDNAGNTIFHYLYLYEKYDQIEELLQEFSPNLHIKNASGYTPLDYLENRINKLLKIEKLSNL